MILVATAIDFAQFPEYPFGQQSRIVCLSWQRNRYAVGLIRFFFIEQAAAGSSELPIHTYRLMRE